MILLARGVVFVSPEVLWLLLLLLGGGECDETPPPNELGEALVAEGVPVRVLPVRMAAALAALDSAW